MTMLRRPERSQDAHDRCCGRHAHHLEKTLRRNAQAGRCEGDYGTGAVSARELECDASAERVPQDVDALESASVEIALDRACECSHRRELVERAGLALPGEIHGEDIEVEGELSADLREVRSARPQSVQQQQWLTGARTSRGK
jgi:hypothetical protein